MKDIILCDRGNYKEIALICKQYNLSVSVDTFSETDIFDVYSKEVNRTLKNYSDVNIVYMHGPYRDLCLESKDKLIQSVTMNRFEYAYRISRLLKCSDIIFHHGYIPGTSLPSMWVKRVKLFFHEFLSDKDDNITFYIENQFEHIPDLIAEVISEVNDSRLKMCLDVGHANCNSKTSVTNWIEQLNDNIGFVHLNNNNGLLDQHLDFLSGSIDFNEVCSALEKYVPSCIWAIETNNVNNTEKSIQWLIENQYIKK